MTISKTVGEKGITGTQSPEEDRKAILGTFYLGILTHVHSEEMVDIE